MMTTEHVSKHERTCVGCGKRAVPTALVRLVLGPENREAQRSDSSEGGARGAKPLERECQIVVDAAGGAFGRGAHVHGSPDCVERACRGGLSRAFKTNVVVDAKALAASIRAAYERRAAGLLLGARRAGHLVLGADAAAKALEDGAQLVVLATDAGAVVKRFERAIAQGRAASFATKAMLGEWFGSGETAVFAVRHQGVARALSEALGVASSVGGSEER